jgi:hypothetical protein
MSLESMDVLSARIDLLEKEIQLLNLKIDNTRSRPKCFTETRGAILELSPEELKMILRLPETAKIDAIQAPRKGNNCDKDIEKLRIRVLNIGPWTNEADSMKTFHPKIYTFGDCLKRQVAVEWPGCSTNP